MKTRPLLLLLLALSPIAPAAAELALPDLSWRLLGPFRAGWATVAAGIADQPDTFFFGAAGGGVWKTSNAGRTWNPISDAAGIVAVGALAIAPSDANVIYVGSGQPEPRYDIAAGGGVYRSGDRGKTWKHLGLAGTRHIGAILVDAHDANIVTVAALGHLFGPDHERGIFRSVDGGQTWTQALFIDDGTGAVDLAADPAHPDVVFAAAWQARDWPWLSYFKPMVGPHSGLYKSVDGGKSWARLDGEGWPQGSLGRIGLAVADTAQGVRLYANVDAEKDGGIWRSDDGGAHWLHVNPDGDTFGGWYFSRMTVAPGDADTLYVSGQSIRRSTDGGKTFTEIRGAPGGDDYHGLWINPAHPQRWIAASDQGAVVSVDGGRTWSDWYNQPTGQFYHLAADDAFPYRLYSGQQDSGTVSIASRGDYGAITFRDWHPIGGDERDYDVPDPADAQIVYGSGLGGRVTRWDARTGQVKNISPWPSASYGKRPTTVKHRYTWITPLVVSHAAPHSLYLGSEVLFRSDDRGEHWSTISPDLTGKVAGTAGCDGDVPIAQAKACGYGVIFSIALAPRDAREIWVGTDDGLVQRTADGGKRWSNVTPPDLPAWARVDTIDVSALDPGTAYVVADNHRQDDFRPLAWRTRDAGKTWQGISAGLPPQHFITVVRADPVRRGLLYAGTDDGVFVSFDDGDHWQSLQLNLPHAWVRDLLLHDDDLAVATQGRALWVLDDVTPLRQVSAPLAAEAAHLFTPRAALRVHANNSFDTPPPPETALGANPPSGATIDYWIGGDAHGEVSLRILDDAGALVRRFSSSDVPAPLKVERYFMAEWLKPAAALAATPGAHRFVWDLRYPRPRALAYDYSIASVFGGDAPVVPRGAFVVPGRYTVVLDAGGRELRAPLVVKADPRVTTSIADLRRSLGFSRAAGAALENAFVAGSQVRAVREQLDALRPAIADPAHAALRGVIDGFFASTDPLATKKEGQASDFATLSGVIAALENDAEAADSAPTGAQQAVLADATAHLNASLATWAALRDAGVAHLNDALRAGGLAPVTVPGADAVEAPSAATSKEIP